MTTLGGGYVRIDLAGTTPQDWENAFYIPCSMHMKFDRTSHATAEAPFRRVVNTCPRVDDTPTRGTHPVEYAARFRRASAP